MTDQSHESPETGDLLRGATDGLAPDVDRLVAGGVARGRVLRRRRRLTTTLAAAAVVGVIGTAASVAPGLLDDGDGAGTLPVAATDGPPSTAPTTIPAGRPAPGTIDALITVSAEDFPQVVAERLPALQVGDLRQDESHPLVDERQEKTAFFDVGGTLASVQIERADSVATCEQQAEQADELLCTESPDGLPLWVYGPATADGVTYQSVTLTVHGYNVTADSYNAADGKDVPVVTEVPPISIDDLTALVTDDVWFAEPAPGSEDPGPVEIAAAKDLPAVVTAVVPGEPVPDEQAGGYIDAGDTQVAHFLLNGMLVTAYAEPFTGDADRACRREGLECTTAADGTVVGVGGVNTAPAADGGYASQAVTAWRDGYTASVLSYNTGDTTTGEIVSPGIPISVADLTAIVTGDGWTRE